MKTLKILAALAFLAIFQMSGYSMGMVKDTSKTVKIKADTAKNDSTEYEVVVMDPGYETFLATQPPKEFYSEDYYKHWNELYVIEWNIRYTTQARSGLYEVPIDYDPKIHYGLEFEYRLYYFFQYFEKSNHVTLIPRRGRS